MMTQFATLAPDAHVEDAVQTLLRTSQSEFPVVDGGGKPVGLLGRGDLIRALKELGPDARVADAMTTHSADHRTPPLPGRGVPDAAGEIGAGCRRRRCERHASSVSSPRRPSARC